jgi:hypothetical protein
MIARIFIEPHERADALEAYGSWLTPDQVDEIMDAPEGAMFALVRNHDGKTTVTVIPEG